MNEPRPDSSAQPGPEDYLRDPRTDATALAAIAQSRPDLWPAVRQHPNCYPELAGWIDRQSAAARPPAPPKLTADQWSAQFQQVNHREPTLGEYQAAVRDGHVAAEPRQRDASAQQMADGARQVASGAKEFFNTRAAPAAQNAVRSIRQSASEQRSSPQTGTSRWAGWAPFALPVAAFVAIISLFMPIVSAMGFSANFFSDEAEGEGGFLLFVMLVTIAAAVTSIIVAAKWARVSAGVMGLVAGVIGMIDGFGNMISVSSHGGASIGAGLVFLALMALVMLACGILILLSLRRVPATTGPPPAQQPPMYPGGPQG